MITCPKCHRTPDQDLLGYFCWRCMKAVTIPDPAPETIKPTLPPPKKENTRDATARWIMDNPQIYEAFEYYALEMHRTGQRFGIAMVRERVRWEARVKWGGDFKIGNNFSPYIARKLVADHPELADTISFRRTKF